MKKSLIIIFLLALCTSAYAQKYFTRNAHISFFSTTPMENIEAHHHQATSIIDIGTGDMAFSVMIKGFEFEKALMQEHFNEKYMETEKHPKSSFEGKITNIDQVDLAKDGTYPVQIAGKLTIHGVTKDVKTEGTMEVKGGKINGKAKFPVTVADYDITIPAVVRDNIAKVVEVSIDATYEPYKKS